MKNKIWLSSPHMGGNELNYVIEAFDTNWIAPLGPNVTHFENELSEYLGVDHCAVLVSGTAAIHLALIISNIGSGDEVICQSFTFSATANPIIYVGATPVFVDSEPDTWNIDPDLLEKCIIERISKGKKPKAILIVHLYGMPAKMDELNALSLKYEIPLIEDAAEALGSRYNGTLCGSFGVMGILSFNGNKIITTSGGGALLSDNKEYISKARFLATQARDHAPHYQHSQIGYNYRMSNVVAGIGRGQLEVLEKRVEQRRENNRFYRNALKQYNGIKFHTEMDYSRSNYWLTTVLIDPELTNGITREDIRLGLQKDNIECRPLWKPMHLQPVFSRYPAYTNGISENLFERGLCLPSGSNLTYDERKAIINSIDKVFSSNTR
jgi:dTDP-4-amino-4,6-dideoxygalactose transaminase